MKKLAIVLVAVVLVVVVFKLGAAVENIQPHEGGFVGSAYEQNLGK